MRFAASAPVDCEPDVGLLPVQPFEAVHEVALVLDQLSVDEAPEAIVVGFAVNVRVGAEALCIVTRAVALPAPPLPVQVSVKSVVALSGPTLCEPDVALLPAQPPDAEHEVAFEEVQLSVED